MACTPKTLRRLVPLLRQELRSASSSNLYSPEHDSRTRYVDHTVKGLSVIWHAVIWPNQNNISIHT